MKNRGKAKAKGKSKATTGGTQSDEPSETDAYSEFDPVQSADAKKNERGVLLTKNERDMKMQSLSEQPAEGNAKLRNMKTRSFFGAVMIISFALIIAAGHMYCALLVLALMACMFHEIIQLKRNVEKDNRIPGFYLIRWYFFSVTVFLLSKRFLAETYDDMVGQLGTLPFKILVRYNNLVIYLLYVLGGLAFILSLRKFTLRYQFHQMSWTVVVILVVVCQSASMMANVYRALIWFIVPQSSVIMNDIFAYFVGIFFGRTPLIALSPKKTWEGFLGGGLFTVAWGWLFVWYLSKYPHFLCPSPSMIHKPFSWWDLTCEIPKNFIEPTPYPFLGLTLWITDLQFHGMVLAIFASLVAPFGGFFASGFKRAFKIKDFADTIPGHGGVTDRFDCHPIMGMFTYFYYHSFVVQSDPFDILSHQVTSLPLEEKEELLRILKNSLGQ